MTWYEAFAFCIWDGGRLPTEAEWKYVAAAGDQERLYPWGQETPGPITQHVEETYSRAPIGEYPKGNGFWGHADLASGAAEWVLDCYAPYTTDACDSCANLLESTFRITRGGSLHDTRDTLRSASRIPVPAAERTQPNGVRCAGISVQ